MYNPILLWSNVSNDNNLVDLIEYIKTLNPSLKAKQLNEMEKKLIPALFESVVNDIKPILPKNMVAFNLKIDRKTTNRIKTKLVEIDKFETWVNKLKDDKTGTHHLYLSDIGDIVRYSVNSEFIETSYLRLLIKNEKTKDIELLKQEIISCIDEPMFEHLMKNTSIPLGYLIEQLYNLQLRLDIPENGPKFPKDIKPTQTVINRIKNNKTPKNIKSILYV